MIDADSIIVQPLALRTAESSYIISHTKNIDTLITRFQMLINLIEQLKLFSDAKTYVSDINIAFDEYKKAYHDRELSDEQIAMIFKPLEFNLKEYYLRSLVNCAAKFTQEKMVEIKQLKKEIAKKKRVQEIVRTIGKVKKEIYNFCAMSEKYNDALAALNQLETECTILQIADTIT